MYSDINPLENDAEARVLTLSSPALKDYLKETNVKSNNYSSQTLFKFLGGEKKLQEFLATNYKLNDDKIHLYTGSGLPAIVNGVRKDNYATCEVMTELVNALKESSEKQDSSLSDIMAVPGADQGTFRRRLNGDETKNGFMAKTGTLMHTSTLSGALSTKSGISFFGVFNQTSDIVSAKTVQDAMVHTIIADLGGVSRFPYNPEPFFTIDDREKMKKFGMDEDAFLPFEVPVK
ncbi:MAG: D-alanyl-D-alanine carboxypeptidase [Bacteriovoracaceae bacterium]|nr:D-alanyl-D-alanine carboxypeptidase [Bacteriovoracaceae bacterium]